MTARPEGSARFAKEASQRRAVSVLQATLRSKGTQWMAVALGKWC